MGGWLNANIVEEIKIQNIPKTMSFLLSLTYCFMKLISQPIKISLAKISSKTGAEIKALRESDIF